MNDDTILYRQIHPTWIQAERVTSQAFKPTTKDKLRLSVYDGDQVCAEDSWRHYTQELGYESAAVLALNVGEPTSIQLKVLPDPEAFPAHVVIGFEGCSRGQIEKKGKQLRKFAEARGWQYRPEADT